jgi:hypothetical protein
MRTADPSIIHRDRARPLCCLLPVRAPHLLDRYGRTPPLGDRVPVPCPRAGGLREMGARARRAGAVAARHVPFPPLARRTTEAAAGRPPPIMPPTSQFSVRVCRPPLLPHGSKTGPCACTRRCPDPNPQPKPGSTLRWLPRPARMAVALACTGRRRGNPVAGSGLLRHRFCPSRRLRATFLFSSFCHDKDRRHRDVSPWPPAWMRELTHQPLPPGGPA